METAHQQVMAALDRALTIPTASTIVTGWAPATAREYLTAWRDFTTWCRTEGWTAMPCTSETLALYVGHLAEHGRKPATIRKHIAGVRAWHRLHGHPVPDGLPALVVLREHESTLTAAGWAPRHTQPLTPDEALRIAEHINPGTVRGRRDACVLMLAYGGMFTAAHLCALRIADVATAGGRLTITHPDRPRPLDVPHWTVNGEHRPGFCPVEAVTGWAGHLTGRGAPPSSPLVRPVDRTANIAGLDPYAGRPHPDGRMSPGSLSRVLAVMLTDAGITDPARYTMESLRVGGIARRRIGGDTVDELATASGLSTAGSTLLGHVRTAERLTTDHQHPTR